MHFLEYGVTPQLDHHLALQKHLLLWSLCPPGGGGRSLRFSHVKTSAFPSSALAPLLSVPLCVLVGHLVWMPSYELPESRRKQNYPVTFPAGSFPPIILSVVNKLFFSPPGRNQVCICSHSFILCNHHLFEGFSSAPKFSCVSF